jgi:hypothetical protein
LTFLPKPPPKRWRKRLPGPKNAGRGRDPCS